MPERLYVFLDANVIFSASYKPDNAFLELWSTPGILVVTSLYAADEARRNCQSQEQSKRLEILLDQTVMVSDPSRDAFPAWVKLPGKDQPILASAIDAGADFLVTGDRNHFASLMNHPIKTRYGSLVIVEPRSFLDFLKTIR